MPNKTRIEHDSLGEKQIPYDALYGIHTARAMENFAVSNYKIAPEFIKAFAMVKKACAETNSELGFLDNQIAIEIIKACDELINGKHHEQIVVDAMQGGAGTSLNMNINEVIANIALKNCGKELGDYSYISPLDHVNMHQSTNDTYPTALKVASLNLLKILEDKISRLQEAFQVKETDYKDIIKTGRTQLQDAVPMTLGMSFGAFAEAISRDRWRIFKCRERIKQVNLGGTAIGSGIGAPRDFILKATNKLRDICGLNISRAENLVDATQNQDCFVEASGMLKAYAANLIKISNDLRLLGSGGSLVGEIKLKPMQAGSTIMAGKVNPVIPEITAQVGLKVIANDGLITQCAYGTNLELCQFMPLLAHSFLETISMLIKVTDIFREKCIEVLEPNLDKSLENANKSQAIATALVPFIGYEAVEKAVKKAASDNTSVKQEVIGLGLLSADKYEEILSPKNLRKLGFTEEDINNFKDNK